MVTASWKLRKRDTVSNMEIDGAVGPSTAASNCSLETIYVGGTDVSLLLGKSIAIYVCIYRWRTDTRDNSLCTLRGRRLFHGRRPLLSSSSVPSCDTPCGR